VDGVVGIDLELDAIDIEIVNAGETKIWEVILLFAIIDVHVIGILA
jgi:hypothetical protein